LARIFLPPQGPCHGATRIPPAVEKVLNKADQQTNDLLLQFFYFRLKSEQRENLAFRQALAAIEESKLR
jgi:hypothetical protein